MFKVVFASDWMQGNWRPLTAIMYIIVCACDFVLFPVLWTWVQVYEPQGLGFQYRQWQPLTLGIGGLFHLAMGAVLGVSAWSRGQEKIAGVADYGNPQQKYRRYTPESTQHLEFPQVDRYSPVPESDQPIR